MLLSAQPKTKPFAVMDLIAPMLHKKEKVTEIVGILDGIVHRAERWLPFGLAESFDVADGFCVLSL